MSMRPAFLAALAAVGICATLPVFAQTKTLYSEYVKTITAAKNVHPYDDSLFGDKVNLYTGSTEFSVVDVSLPGNSTIPVAVGRRYVVEDRAGRDIASKMAQRNAQFGTWSLDVPYLSGVFARITGWVSSNEVDPDRRCSVGNITEAAPPTVYAAQDSTEFAPGEYWHGNYLHVPGQGDQEMMVVNPDNPEHPTTGGPYHWVTKNQWFFSCSSTVAHGASGESFVAVAPDGTRYWFDWFVDFPVAQAEKPHGMPPVNRLRAGTGLVAARHLPPASGNDPGKTLKGAYSMLRRDEIRIYPTRIEDRFGNSVVYTFDASNERRLVSIEGFTPDGASDGRRIDISYDPESGFIDRVTTGTRTWQYAYDGDSLIGVTLPDSSQWTYAFSDLDQAHIKADYVNPACWGPPMDQDQASYTGTVTHPSGAEATFTFKPTLHGRSQMPDDGSNCIMVSWYEGGTAFIAVYPPLFAAISIQSKSISGPGIPPLHWNYEYSDAVSCETGNPCPGQKTVTVNGPGKWQRFTFSNRFHDAEGMLEKVETGSSESGILSTTLTTYLTNADGQAFPAKVGLSPMPRGDHASERYAPQLTRDVLQQDVLFTWTAEAFDSFARPTVVTRDSDLSYPRTETTTFHDNKAAWVIGQVSSTTVDGQLVRATNFNAKDKPSSVSSFGLPPKTMLYHPDGTLASLTDEIDHTTQLGDWWRGIPRTIQYADGESTSAEIGPNGWISQVKDENGYTTKYDYDAMGRIAEVTYPADEVDWAPTISNFQQVTSGEYGIPENHWRQTVSTGDRTKVTYFDAYWRPLLVREYDNRDASTTLSARAMLYGELGLPEFASYPLDVMPTLSGSNWLFEGEPILGERTRYDALGRVTQVDRDWELSGVLSTKTGYESGFTTEVTNPRGKTTTTSYLAWDEPTTDFPTLVKMPGGVSVAITRDSFGNPESITRSGNGASLTRQLVYDAHKRLCRRVEPETRSTMMELDAAGNIIGRAAGIDVNVSGCGSIPASARVSMIYDKRDRLVQLQFPDGRGDQSWSYTPDGLPEAVTTHNADSTDTVINTYSYNHRRLLTSETQEIPGLDASTLAYAYNEEGAIAALTYPDQEVVTFAPDAMGRPTQASAYATNVSYYPNGAMAAFQYGNGVVHSMHQNARGLPEVSQDSLGSTDILHDEYDYDQNGNVAAITDAASGTNGHGDRTMTYDALDRLVLVDAPQLYGSNGAQYAYDALDNLTRVVAPGRDQYYCYDEYWHLANVKPTPCDQGETDIGLGYDVRGNLANKNGRIFDFDFGNRLREVTDLERYRYDAFGRRVSATAAEGTIYSMYDRNGVLRYQKDERQAKVFDYITLNGSLVARVETTTASRLAAPVIDPLPGESASSFVVSWHAVDGASTYSLEEKVDTSDWQVAQHSNALEATFSDKAAGVYSYRVQACDPASICGPYSEVATTSVAGAVHPDPSAPVLDVHPSDTDGDYSVDWTILSAPAGYELDKTDDAGLNWETIEIDGSALSYTINDDPPGVYGYRMRACGEDGACTGNSNTGTIVVLGTPEMNDLESSTTSGDYVVSWQPVPGDPWYRLYESRDGGTSWERVENDKVTSMAFAGKSYGTYSYKVRSCKFDLCDDEYSRMVSISVLTPPEVPTAFDVPLSDEDGAYSISWASPGQPTSFRLLERVDGAASWTQRDIDGGSRNVAISNRSPGVYDYRLQACNGSTCSAFTETRTLVVLGTPVIHPLNSPNTTGNYTVSWSAVPGNPWYRLYESTDGGSSWERVQNDPALSMSFSGKSQGTYSYEVRSCKHDLCDDEFSEVASVTVVVPPADPTGFSVPPSDANGTYVISWASPDQPMSYTLLERVNGGSWIPRNISGATTSITISGKQPAVYDYRLQACNVSVCSGFTDTSTLVVLGTPLIHSLSTPNATGDYTVSWSAVPGDPWYRLYESTDGGSTWLRAQNYPDLSMSFSGKPKGTYSYKVRSCKNGLCDDTYSDVETISIVDPPRVPTLSVPKSDANGTYSISWSSMDSPTGYKLRERVNGSSWNTTSLGGSARSQSFTGRAPAVYDYQIAACIGSSCSANSATASIVVLGAPVMNDLPSTSSTGNYTVSWQPVPGNPWYRLYESTNGGTDWTRVQNDPATSMSFSNKASGTYSYEVRACKSSLCDDEFSDVETITVNRSAGLMSGETGTGKGTSVPDRGINRGGMVR